MERWRGATTAAVDQWIRRYGGKYGDALIGIGVMSIAVGALLSVMILGRSRARAGATGGGAGRARKKRMRSPPGPWAWPVIGNLVHLHASFSYRSLALLARRYGPLLLLRMGALPTLVASSPSAAQHLLSLHDKAFASRPPSEAARRLLYGADKVSFFTPYGPAWRLTRKAYATHLLSSRRVHDLHLPVLALELRRLILRLLHASSTSPPPPPPPPPLHPPIVDLTAAFSSLMEDTICRITFSRYAPDVNVLIPPGATAAAAAAPAAASSSRHPRAALSPALSKEESAGHPHAPLKLNLAHIVHQGSPLLATPLMTDVFPLLGFLDRPAKRAMDRWFSSFDTVMEAIFRERETELRAKEYGRLPESGSLEVQHHQHGGHDGQSKDAAPSLRRGCRDILDVLLAWDDEPPLSREKMKAMMLEVIAAGIETTSTTLDWAMAEMLSNPGVLKKVQEEVDSVVGMDRMVELADPPRLQYTKAVVKETLRKHPALPLLLPHFSMEACELEDVVGADEWSSSSSSSSSRDDDDMQERRRSRSVYYDIAAGTKVLVNAWAIQNDPRVWAEAERFKPERFMEGSPKAHVDVRGQHFELIPFGSGRRMCPGMTLALGALELTLGTLVHCFEWQPAADDDDVATAAAASVDLRERPGVVVTRATPLFAMPIKTRLSNDLVASLIHVNAVETA